MSKYFINYNNFVPTMNYLKGGSQRILKKDFLIIIPAGDNSYHHQRKWYNSNIYDLYTIYYGNDDKKATVYQENSNFFLRKKGPKWQLVRYVLNNFDWKKYKYVWLPDDDLDIEKEKIEKFLLVSQSLNLELSQISLRVPGVDINDQIKILNDWYSYNFNNYRYTGFYKFHQIKGDKNTELITQYISYKVLMQHYPSEQKVVRYTNFVEIMCPLLSTKLLAKTYQWINYDDVQSGFGIDKLWPEYLNNQNMAVIDFISAIHTRPVGNFQNKKTGNFKVLTVVPEEEEITTIERSKIKIKNIYKETLKQITLNKPKIAFLFLTIGDVRYPEIWQEYFKGHSDKINYYIHPKDKTLVKSFLKEKIISNIIETKWGDVSIIKAMNNLLEEAYKNGENQKFVFMSESGLPIRNFNQFYNFLEELDKSVFTLGNGMGQHYSRFKYLKNPKRVGLTEKTFYKSETWCILNREHVKTILENQKYYLPVFKNVRVPEEHFNVSITLIKHGKDSFIDRRTTFVDWPEGYSPHPTTFGPKLNSSDKKLIKNSRKISFFARKFTKEIDAKDNNIIKFILELIK